MGIQGLLPFLRNSSRPVNLSEFKGSTAAVDVYCWLHKGAFSCAEKLVKGEQTDGYVVYVMKQISLLLSFNIKPILVFDGCHLPAKEVTEFKRRENRARNRQKAKDFLREGRVKEARECFQRCVEVTSAMAYEVIKACRARNVDIIVAPYEADAQLAFLSHSGIADVIITEDSDLVLFGCEKIIFKMDGNGGGCLVEKEKLHLSLKVPRDKFEFEKFRNMCILSGCDYLPSLHGIGLVKACKFFMVTSNPDVFNSLCRLPAHLKMPKLDVTLEYRQGFMKAVDTILHQLVFDPFTLTLRPLTPYPNNISSEDLPYCGPFLGHERAHQIALGNVNVQTGQVIDDYLPGKSKRPEMKSSSWNQKGDVVSNHPSIWDRNYGPMKEEMEKKREDEKEEEERKRRNATKGKERVVNVSMLKRKRIDVEPVDEAASEDYLKSIYCCKKSKDSNIDDELKGESILKVELSEEVPPNGALSENIKDECVSTSNCYLSKEDHEIGDVKRLFGRYGNKLQDKILPNYNVKQDNFTDNKQNVLRETGIHHTFPIEINRPITDTIKNNESKLDIATSDTDVDNTPITATPASPKFVSRNPFAKKISKENLENEKPMKTGVFSALKNFNSNPKTPVIVRSRFFKLTPKSSERSPIVTSPEKNGKTEESNKSTVMESVRIKSPLSPRNEFVEETSSSSRIEDDNPTSIPKKPKQRQCSFNWNNKSFLDRFAFNKVTKTEVESPCTKTTPSIHPKQVNETNTHPLNHNESPVKTSFDLSSSQLLDTPPKSQTSHSAFNDDGFTLTERDESTNICDITTATTAVLTPPDERSHLMKFKSKVVSTPKCRVSGLKRKSSSAAVATGPKQLNLREMFAFKK